MSRGIFQKDIVLIILGVRPTLTGIRLEVSDSNRAMLEIEGHTMTEEFGQLHR